MTISDEELYKRAKTARDRYDQYGIGCLTTNDFLNAIDSVLQRFKPREPIVFEAIGYVNQLGRFVTVEPGESSRKWAAIENGYPAKAIITEVMDSDQ